MSTYDEEVVGNICVAASLMPYHQGTEICYNHYEDYTFDHRHYFAVQVPEFGKAGCDVSTIVENSEDWIKS
ncbi:hypothetical protein ANCCEY_01257 [Ancylostoma ceylanicum]|uniref:Uncharacterized protein n=1 Tax=Ancylostoma ceylanicum TaxID=53326 RepID=A0A0D6M887_9BILA|nr:hypothetical protein ANCCEY_01257 [Ancylostoma ceylanicum]